MKRLMLVASCLVIFSCGTSTNRPERIIDMPILFNQEREQLSLEYLGERYGLEQDAPTIEPKMIVLHWTAIPTLKSSYNAFKDPVLPGAREEIRGAGSLNVSAHFLMIGMGRSIV